MTTPREVLDLSLEELAEQAFGSFGVNAEHGYARDRDDVARILKAILEDEEWRAIPLREIARHTRIAVMTVQRHHERHVAASVPLGQIPKPAARTVTRGGTTYTMDTGAIGKSKRNDDEDDVHRELAEREARIVAALRRSYEQFLRAFADGQLPDFASFDGLCDEYVDAIDHVVAPLRRLARNVDRAAVWSRLLEDHREGIIRVRDVENAIRTFKKPRRRPA